MKFLMVVSPSNIGAGAWELKRTTISCESLNKKIILRDHLVSLELVSSKNDKTLGGRAAAGLVGAAVAGPLGAAVGALHGGGKRTEEAIVRGVLSDGKSFVAHCSNFLVPELMACITSTPKDGPSVKNLKSKARLEKERQENIHRAEEAKKDAPLMVTLLITGFFLFMTVFYIWGHFVHSASWKGALIWGGLSLIGALIFVFQVSKSEL